MVFVPSDAEHLTAQQWSAEATRLGFQLAVPSTFEPARQCGGLSVVCDELEASFEFYNDSISEYLEEVGGGFAWWTRLRLRRYARAIGFVTHSRQDDWRAAVIGAATYASATKGTLLDCQTGRFVSLAHAPAWARSLGGAVPAALPARRARIRASCHDHVASVLAQLGYQPFASPPDGASLSDRWYARPGTRYSHELVEVSVYFDGEGAFLSTAFFGTSSPLQAIQSSGIIGQAAGRDRFDYLFDVLGEPFDGLLPKAIPLAEDFSDTPAAAQLRSEILRIHPGIFDDLWQREDPL